MSENYVPPAQQEDEVGRVIVADSTRDRYVVRRTLGEGGMGKVYQATWQRTGELWAIKTVRDNPALTQQVLDSFADAFRWESHVWFILGKHRNIVQALAFDRDRQQRYHPFLGMEYVLGGSLRDRLDKLRRRRELLALPQTLKTSVEILTGLLYAGQVMRDELEMSFVHRDLKPENILLDENGVAKVSDFGLVKAFSKLGKNFSLKLRDGNVERMTYYAGGEGGGTPPYMSPEQWLCDILDERTDVYAVGCILYEMLTGQRPFLANSIEDYARKHLHEPPPFSPLMGRSLPQTLIDLLQRCLAKRKEERPFIREAREGLQEIHRLIYGHLVGAGETAEPGEVHDWGNWGSGFAHLGRHRKAVDYFNKAIELNPNLAAVYNNRGNAYQALGDHARGMADYDMSIQLDPDYAPAYYNRGNAYYRLGDIPQAISDYSSAVELDPEYVSAYSNRGLAYKALGDLSRAIADHDQALELDPNDTTAYNNRGITYRALGDNTRAIADYDKALELDPNYAMAYRNRGNAYKDIGDLIRAISDYDKAVELDPNKADAYFGRGNVYKALADLSRAITDYEKALKLAPDFAAAYFNRGNAYNDLGDHVRAIDDYSRVIDLDPDDCEAYYNRAVILEECRRYSEAANDYEAFVSLARPEDAEFVDEARRKIVVLRREKQLILPQGRDAEALYQRGVDYSNNGDFDRAITEFAKTTEINPGHALAYYDRAQCLERLERYDEATGDYEAFIRLSETMDNDRQEIVKKRLAALLESPQKPGLLGKLWNRFRKPK